MGFGFILHLPNQPPARHHKHQKSPQKSPLSPSYSHALQVHLCPQQGPARVQELNSPKLLPKLPAGRFPTSRWRSALRPHRKLWGGGGGSCFHPFAPLTLTHLHAVGGFAGSTHAKRPCKQISRKNTPLQHCLYAYVRWRTCAPSRRGVQGQINRASTHNGTGSRVLPLPMAEGA